MKLLRMLVVVLLVACGYGCGESKSGIVGIPALVLPPPSGSRNDDLYKEQRMKRHDYSETTEITACSADSSNCYSLTADLQHHFGEKGKEIATVQQIHFANGGYLVFGETPIPDGGTDSKGRSWTFSW